MGRFKLAFLALLIGCGLVIGTLLFAPALILLPIANAILQDYGYTLTEIEDLRLGPEASSFASVSLASDSLQLSAQSVELAYGLSDLLGGQLRSLHIHELRLEANIGNSATGLRTAAENLPLSIPALLQTLDQIPIDDIRIEHIFLNSGAAGVSLDMAMRSRPLTLDGELYFSDTQQFKIDFRARRSGIDSFAVNGSIYIDDELAIDSEIAISFSQKDIDIDAQSNLHLVGLQKLSSAAELSSNTVILTDTLLLDSKFTLQNPFESPSIKGLALRLDSPSSVLHIEQQSDLGDNQLLLQLPLLLTADSASLESGITLRASDIFATGFLRSKSAGFSAESSLRRAKLECSSLSSCDFSAAWDYTLTDWKIAGVSGNDLKLSGIFALNFANRELRASSTSLEVTIPSIRTADSNSSAQLLIEELEFKIGDSLLGGFTFTSTELNPDIASIHFGQSTLAGKVSVTEEVLVVIAEIDVNQQLRMGIALQQFFFRDYGDAEIQLSPLEFTRATPLSSLIDSSVLNGDIAAGKITGHANISWSRQPDSSWEFGGPVIVNLENLSGIFNKALFLDLNTRIFAELTTPWGIRTNALQSASIASIDFGLPLSNISWQYSFDSQAAQLEVDKLNIELLGGTVSIEALDFIAGREHNEIPVIISNLDLNSIVQLADYPALVVDGLVSGYLPLVLSGGKITLEEGLVAALKPGGSIRYTPANSMSSSNPGLQLVNDALSNYRYETMNTEVYYDEKGELLMQVQLRGSNPDMNDGQAINLNINISDNIPTLLRSLQASRVITDELELILRRQ